VCIKGQRQRRYLVESDSGIGSGRAEPTEEAPQHLCLDRGTTTAQARVPPSKGYVPHRRIGEKDERGETTPPLGGRANFGWLSRWRGILIRWEKKADNYLALCWPVLCFGIAELRFRF